MNAKKTENNPVARLRDKFLNRKKKCTPSAELKETLRKKEALDGGLTAPPFF